MLYNQVLDVLEVFDLRAVRDTKANGLNLLRQSWRGTAIGKDIVGQSLLNFVSSEVLLVTNTVENKSQPLLAAGVKDESRTHEEGQRA
jgi:hypothetical protein